MEERERLFGVLQQFDFLQPYPSQANFILCSVRACPPCPPLFILLHLYSKHCCATAAPQHCHLELSCAGDRAAVSKRPEGCTCCRGHYGA